MGMNEVAQLEDVGQEVMPSLDELTETAVREHDLVVQHGLLVIDHAIRAGDALLAAKSVIPMGKFTTWVESRGIPSHIAAQYMRIARHKDIVQFHQPHTLTTAVRLLRGAPRTDVVPDNVKAEVRRLRGQDWTIRAIEEQVGLSKNQIYRIIDPNYAVRKRKDGQKSNAARSEKRREERLNLAKKAGGGYSQGYSLLRRLEQLVDGLSRTTADPEARRLLSSVVHSLERAEDNYIKALKHNPQ